MQPLPHRHRLKGGSGDIGTSAFFDDLLEETTEHIMEKNTNTRPPLLPMSWSRAAWCDIVIGQASGRPNSCIGDDLLLAVAEGCEVCARGVNNTFGRRCYRHCYAHATVLHRWPRTPVQSMSFMFHRLQRTVSAENPHLFALSGTREFQIAYDGLTDVLAVLPAFPSPCCWL